MSPSGRLDLVAIGSMVVDRLHRVRRIVGPSEKGPLLRFEDGEAVRRCVGGVILNQAGWAAALGLRVGLFGRQADDERGRFLRRAMCEAGIEPHLVLDGESSSEAQIYVDASGERAIYMDPGATAQTRAEDLRRHHSEFIARASWLSTEVSQLPLEAARAAVGLARAHGLRTAVDLDVPPSEAVPALGDEAALRALLTGVDLLKPALEAARELAPEAGSDALALARRLRELFGAGAVAVTDGARGCAISADGFEGRVGAYPVRAVDATGAGDAFLGGLIAGRVYGLDWRSAARLANACGAACVEQVGAFPADREAARRRVLQLYDGPPVGLRALPPPLAAGEHEALATIDIALEELGRLRSRLAPEPFDAAARLIREAEAKGGRVHVTGVGKPEHVARYAAALLASTGTPATFLHATEAVHGSAGQVVAGDVVIAISNSGETGELRAAVEAVRGLGARLLAVTGSRDSWLAREADAVLEARVEREGGGLGLAPRASVAAEVLVVAALAAVLERARGLTLEQYHARHPAGALGERARRRR